MVEFLIKYCCKAIRVLKVVMKFPRKYEITDRLNKMV